MFLMAKNPNKLANNTLLRTTIPWMSAISFPPLLRLIKTNLLTKQLNPKQQLPKAIRFCLIKRTLNCSLIRKTHRYMNPVQAPKYQPVEASMMTSLLSSTVVVWHRVKMPEELQLTQEYPTQKLRNLAPVIKNNQRGL